jgi:hypothetical protein
MTTLPVTLKRSWRDKSNNTTKGHKPWTGWAIRAFQKCRGSLVSEPFVWFILIIVGDLSLCRCILLIDIFPTIPIVLSSEFWCFSEFFFLFLSHLFLLNLVPFKFCNLKNFVIWKNHWWHLELVDIISWLSKLCIFLNIFSTVLFYHFFLACYFIVKA